MGRTTCALPRRLVQQSFCAVVHKVNGSLQDSIGLVPEGVEDRVGPHPKAVNELIIWVKAPIFSKIEWGFSNISGVGGGSIDNVIIIIYSMLIETIIFESVFLGRRLNQILVLVDFPKTEYYHRDCSKAIDPISSPDVVWNSNQSLLPYLTIIQTIALKLNLPGVDLSEPNYLWAIIRLLHSKARRWRLILRYW